MVIEYNGTVLRKEVAAMKEKTYRSQVGRLAGRAFSGRDICGLTVILPRQNRAVFMFRIDSEHVVDATRTGGLAR